MRMAGTSDRHSSEQSLPRRIDCEFPLVKDRFHTDSLGMARLVPGTHSVNK